MKIELEVGETVTVTFKDSDGEIKVLFGDALIQVSADMPDTQGREGIIYQENFGRPIDGEVESKS